MLTPRPTCRHTNQRKLHTWWTGPSFSFVEHHQFLDVVLQPFSFRKKARKIRVIFHPASGNCCKSGNKMTLNLLAPGNWCGVGNLEAQPALGNWRRLADKMGYDLADEATDIGRQRVGADVNEARKCFAEICRAWYPVIRDLHRFFIAISRAVVNDDGKGGWCAGSKSKKRKPMDAVRDLAMIPGPVRLGGGGGSFKWPRIDITAADVARWPFSTGVLIKLAAFLSDLPWPTEVIDLGLGGVSFVELLIL